MTADWTMSFGEQRLNKAFVKSLVFHGTLAAVLIGWAWVNPTINLGDEQAGGGAVRIEAVSIPLPTRGPENPVANNTESMLPPTPPEEKPAPKELPKPDEKDAEEIPDVKAVKNKLPALPKNVLPNLRDQIKPNQIPSKTPQQLSSPLFQPLTGGGAVGSNIDAVMGDRFGAYAKLIRDITARNWHQDKIDKAGNSPSATVRYVLLRSGKTQNVRIVKHSMTSGFDQSILDAVETANYPQLPPDFNKDSVEVEFVFELKR